MHKQNNVEIRKGLEGYVAKPKTKTVRAGMVVIMEAYGITGHIQGVCKRLADAGYAALAPDLFHGELIPYNTAADTVIAKIKTLKDEAMLGEVAASLDWLDAQGTKGQNGIIGFCMGGRLAFLSNCRFPDRLQAAVGFYGSGIAPGTSPDRFGRTPPVGEAAAMKNPIFLGYGVEDQGIPPAEHARVADALSSAKKRYTLAVYPGAGHAFLCEERGNYAPEVAKLAWRDALDFLNTQFG